MKNLKLYENFGEGTYTLDEMDAFVNEVIGTIEWSDESAPRWKRTRIGFPGRRGEGSPQAYSAEDAAMYWDSAKKIYAGDKDARWHVWIADVGGSLNKPKMHDKQHYDIDSILNIVRKYPDAVRQIAVSVDSDEQKRFAKFMSQEFYSGKPGSYTGD